MPRDLIDLSHPIDNAIPMFPGLPAPTVEAFVSREASRGHYAEGTTFVIHRYAFIGNSGTYLDVPFHRFADGVDLATLALASTVNLPGVIVDARASVAAPCMSIGPDTLDGLDLAGRAVLVCTGWDTRWGDSSYLLPDKPFVTADAAELLADKGAALIGIDSWNLDDVADLARPAHSILLRAGIPIAENLRGLNALVDRQFTFFAAPLAIRGGSAVPVRAFALVDDRSLDPARRGRGESR